LVRSVKAKGRKTEDVKQGLVLRLQRSQNSARFNMTWVKLYCDYWKRNTMLWR